MNKKNWVSSLLALSLVSSLSVAPVFADGAHGENHDNGKHLGWNKNYTVNFYDIDDQFSWAKESIQRLAEEGIIRGMDEHHFQPAGKLNRAQFSVLVSRFFGLQPADLSREDFLDVHNGDWYFHDIEAAKDYMTMFIHTSGGYDFKPDQPINRAEAAVTLVQLLIKHNTVQLISQDEANQILSVYQDAYLIPTNLRVHVATAVKAGVIRGVSSNQFDPLSTLNRAQAATLLWRLQSDLRFLPIDPTTGQPIEVVPGNPGSTGSTTDTTSPSITYQTSSYSLNVGDQVSVSTNEIGAVYLVPAAYAPTTVNSLDTLANGNLAVKSTVGTANSTVTLSTTNLAAGDYVVYASDLSGNISKLSNYIHLTSYSNVDTTPPTITYQSSSYNLTVGDQVNVSSNEMGAVYLVPTTYSPNNVSALDSLYTSNLAAKTIVGNRNNSVSLNTNNLATGDYIVYAVDLSGNISKWSNTVHLSAQSSIASVQQTSRTTDSNGVTHLTIGIQTSNINNNTQATFELVNSNGVSLNPAVAVQTVIINNAASAILDIPATLQSGNYKIRVTVGSSTDQSSSFTK